MSSKIQTLISNLREAGEPALARMIEICLEISEAAAIQHIQEAVEDYSGIRAELCAAFLAEMNAAESTIESLNIIEQLAFLGYSPEEISADTYIYTDSDGLCGIEKHDRYSQPDDLLDGGEYVVASFHLNEAKEALRSFLAIS